MMTGPAGDHRKEMIASTIQRLVQATLARGLADPRIRGLITVTGVELSDDKRTAEVRVSVLPEHDASLTLHGLRSASDHIRHQIADGIRLRHTPTLRFVLDSSLKRQAAVLDALSEAQRRRVDLPDNDDSPSSDPTPGAPNPSGTGWNTTGRAQSQEDPEP